MKVVFPTCCGGDVHKSFLVAAIIKPPSDGLQPSHQKNRFSTFNSDMNRFADRFHGNDCLDVCMEAIEGYEITAEQKIRIGIVCDHLRFIDALIGQVDACIDVMVQKYEGYTTLLCPIPGVDRNSAITSISGIGTDMAQFGSSSVFAVGPGLPQAATNLPVRKSLSAFHAPEFTSNLL